MGRKPKENNIVQCEVYLRRLSFDLFGGKEKALKWIHEAYEEEVKRRTAGILEEERRQATPTIITDLTK